LNIPAQAELGPLAKLGYTSSVGRILPVVGNALAGASAFYDIGEAFDRSSNKDPLGAAVHGLSAVFNTMSMVPPTSPIAAGVKGAGILGSLGMMVPKFMLPGDSDLMNRIEQIRPGERFPAGQK
jgi:hypothetical protein